MSRVDRTILGLDPGLARVGYAILRGSSRTPRLITCGTLATPVRTERGTRLMTIARGLRRLIARYRPYRVVIERLFFQKNTSTAMAVSEARGVLLLICAEMTLPVTEFTPNEIKHVVTGSGNADKRAVAKMVRLILHLHAAPTDDDAADAVAIALSGALGRGGNHGC